MSPKDSWIESYLKIRISILSYTLFLGLAGDPQTWNLNEIIQTKSDTKLKLAIKISRVSTSWQEAKNSHLWQNEPDGEFVVKCKNVPWPHKWVSGSGPNMTSEVTEGQYFIFWPNVAMKYKHVPRPTNNWVHEVKFDFQGHVESMFHYYPMSIPMTSISSRNITSKKFPSHFTCYNGTFWKYLR